MQLPFLLLMQQHVSLTNPTFLISATLQNTFSSFLYQGVHHDYDMTSLSIGRFFSSILPPNLGRFLSTKLPLNLGIFHLGSLLTQGVLLLYDIEELFGFHPYHQSYHYHHHSHNAYHVNFSLWTYHYIEDHIHAQLRQKVQPNLQKHEDNHMKTT